LKIAFVSYHYWPPHFGGELLLSIERFQSLVERGHEVHVFTSGSQDMASDEVVEGLVIHRSPKIGDSRIGKGIRRLLFPWWVRGTLKNFSPNIIHYGGVGGISDICNYLGFSLLNAWAQKHNAKTVIVHSLADNDQEAFSQKGWSSYWRNKSFKGIQKIVSVSPYLNEGVKKVFPEKAELIILGVRDDLFLPVEKKVRSQTRETLLTPENAIVFSFLGTVNERKGFDLLLEAYKQLRKDGLNACLWVIGPNSKRENQNFIASSINIDDEKPSDEEEIRYLGRIDNREYLAKLIGSSDVFVFPSRREGFGLAPVEAMSTGIPVIISRIRGVTDLANLEGITGYYSKMGDAVSLKKLMLALAEDKDLRARMGKAARERVIKEFGWKTHVTNWENLYMQLTDEGQR